MVLTFLPLTATGRVRDVPCACARSSRPQLQKTIPIAAAAPPLRKFRRVVMRRPSEDCFFPPLAQQGEVSASYADGGVIRRRKLPTPPSPYDGDTSPSFAGEERSLNLLRLVWNGRRRDHFVICNSVRARRTGRMSRRHSRRSAGRSSRSRHSRRRR